MQYSSYILRDHILTIKLFDILDQIESHISCKLDFIGRLELVLPRYGIFYVICHGGLCHDILHVTIY